VPNANKVMEIPAATTAPAIIGRHSTDGTSDAATGTNTPGALMSVHSKEGENEHDDDDQTDQINNTVHCCLRDMNRLRAERAACLFVPALQRSNYDSSSLTARYA
jgi:hypothetical protein